MDTAVAILIIMVVIGASVLSSQRARLRPPDGSRAFNAMKLRPS
jgi:hypothetical protein